MLIKIKQKIEGKKVIKKIESPCFKNIIIAIKKIIKILKIVCLQKVPCVEEKINYLSKYKIHQQYKIKFPLLISLKFNLLL